MFSRYGLINLPYFLILCLELPQLAFDVIDTTLLYSG